MSSNEPANGGDTPRQYITIECVYFKDSGKYYAHGSDKYNPELFRDCIYPRDYGHKLLEIGKLPGLENGTWDGPFMVNNGQYPELVTTSPTKNPYMAFVTGSYAYGTPNDKSDIDLVVLCSYTDEERLRRADKDQTDDEKILQYQAADAKSLRFGKMNLLLASSIESFLLWKEGTEELKKLAVNYEIDRDYACKFLAKLRKKHHIQENW